jgi:hypothetical protein
MGGVRQAADTAKNQATDALENARVKTRATPQSPAMGPRALIALQRSAGNAAINALMAGRPRFPGKQATGEIDSAWREIRRDGPVLDTVEKGSKRKAAGVPVDLEGVLGGVRQRATVAPGVLGAISMPVAVPDGADLLSVQVIGSWFLPGAGIPEVFEAHTAPQAF